MTDKKYFTEQGLEKLKEELNYLKTTKSKEIAERLKKAASFGDISDSAAYDEAKEALTFLVNKIAELNNLIKNAEVVKKEKETNIIQVGSIVYVSFDSQKEKFQIVGVEETNPNEGKISYESPLGKALLKKSLGEKVEIKTPEGKLQYTIIKIE